jgi:pilus assembly protein CpaE
MTQHRSGLYLLPRPVHLQEVSQVGADDVRRVLGLLKASFTHVVVDLSKSYSELDMAALSEADQVLLVTQLDIPCLRNVVRLSMSFDEIEGLRDKTRVVVNRVGLDAGQIGIKKAQDTIGREIFWQVPNDYRTMGEVRNNGVPLLEQFPKAGITQSIVALAAALDGGDAASAQDKAHAASGWLNFWPTRRVLARRES